MVFTWSELCSLRGLKEFRVLLLVLLVLVVLLNKFYRYEKIMTTKLKLLGHILAFRVTLGKSDANNF